MLLWASGFFLLLMLCAGNWLCEREKPGRQLVESRIATCNSAVGQARFKATM